MAEAEPRASNQGPCPTDATLVQWQQGLLPPPREQELMRHLDACPGCQSQVEALVAGDPFCRHLRAGAGRELDLDSNEVDHIVARMRILASAADPAVAPPGAALCPRFEFLGPPEAPGLLGQLGLYRVRRLLGQGGMGLVFEAEDVQLERPVALKVLRPEIGGRPGGAQRFLREARLAAALRHDHVITIYQVGEANGVPFLAMELLQGLSLEQRLRIGPPPSVAESVRIGLEVATGLAAAHARGLIHRDIKPDNIWLQEPAGRVKLLDFGLARSATDAIQVTQSGLIVGTLAYMAPEQADALPVDSRADLFGLGCVLYRLVAARPPFLGSTPLAILRALAVDTPPLLHDLNPAVPPALGRLVAALLARDPADRPSSAEAVAVELKAIAAELDADPPSPPRPRRGRAAPTLGLLAGLTALALIITIYSPRHHDATGVVLPSSSVPSPDQPVATSLLPEAADALRRADIPEELLIRAGGGDPAQAPPELVAVLGGARFFPADGTAYPFLCTRFSPDGRLLATCADQAVVVYEAATGKALWRLRHDRVCSWFDFRPDGKVLAVSWEEGIDLWDLATGQPLGRLTGHAHRDRCLCYTPDGRSLISTDADGQARLWDVAAREVVRAFRPPDGHRYTQSPQVHRDGRLAALHAAGPDPVVQVLDLMTGETRARLPGAGPVPAAAGLEYQATVRFSPDGELLAIAREGQRVRLWKVATWQEAGLFDGEASILGFSAHGDTLLRGFVWHGAGQTEIHIDDARTRTNRARIGVPVAGDVTWSDLSPDGRTVAFRAGHVNTVALLDVATGRELFPRPGHRSAVSAVAMSPDGRMVLSTGYDHRALLWDLAARPGSEPQQVPAVQELFFFASPYHVLHSPAFSPDGQWAAALVQDRNTSIRVWDTTTGKEIANLASKDGDRQRAELVFHPRGGSLLVASNNRLEKWSVRDGSSVTSDEAHDQEIATVAFHPDGRQAVAGDRGGAVVLWDADHFRQLRQFRCDGPVLRVRFSPDGHWLAATTAAPDAALYCWNLQSGVRTRRAGHSASVDGLAWQPDGRGLATASLDGSVRLWSLDLETEPRTMRLHAGKQRQLAFTPEGRHLVTANEDGSIFVLRLAIPP